MQFLAHTKKTIRRLFQESTVTIASIVVMEMKAHRSLLPQLWKKHISKNRVGHIENSESLYLTKRI